MRIRRIFYRLNRRPGLKNQEAGMGRTWNSDPQLEPLAIPTTNDLIWFDGVNNYFDMKCYFQVPEKLKDNGYPEPVWKLLKASFRQEKHYYFISSTVSPIQLWNRKTIFKHSYVCLMLLIRTLQNCVLCSLIYLKSKLLNSHFPVYGCYYCKDM